LFTSGGLVNKLTLWY